MGQSNTKLIARMGRKARIKKRIKPERGIPRLCVFRSNKHIYVQLIDDKNGKVLTSSSTKAKELAGKIIGNNLAAAKQVGTAIADKAKKLSLEKVCFDRNGYRYHGKVKALADAAREAGLKF